MINVLYIDIETISIKMESPYNQLWEIKYIVTNSIKNPSTSILYCYTVVVNPGTRQAK